MRLVHDVPKRTDDSMIEWVRTQRPQQQHKRTTDDEDEDHDVIPRNITDAESFIRTASLRVSNQLDREIQTHRLYGVKHGISNIEEYLRNRNSESDCTPDREDGGLDWYLGEDSRRTRLRSDGCVRARAVAPTAQTTTLFINVHNQKQSQNQRRDSAYSLTVVARTIGTALSTGLYVHTGMCCILHARVYAWTLGEKQCPKRFLRRCVPRRARYVPSLAGGMQSSTMYDHLDQHGSVRICAYGTGCVQRRNNFHADCRATVRSHRTVPMDRWGWCG